MGGNDGLIYLLITTEFKKTEQKLGKLEDFSKKTSEFISTIDNELVNIVNTIPNYKPETKDESLLVTKIRELSGIKKNIENSILEKVKPFFGIDEKVSIENFYKFIDDKENQNQLILVIGTDEYENIISDIKKINLLNFELNVISKYIKTEKEEEKERLRFLQLTMEESILINSDIEKVHKNNIIKGLEFRAIILNHHFMIEPYIHSVYTVLRYDIIKKKIYVDLFVSNRQYLKPTSLRRKEFIPKMFDENMTDGGFAENYALKIYEFMKSDVTNIHLLYSKLNILDSHVFSESQEHIIFDHDRIKLNLQKNIVQYLSGFEPIDDNQTKVKLCNLRSPPSLPADDAYKFVIKKTKKLIDEKGILAEKSYTVIATSINLLMNDIIFEKKGEEDNHAESLLIKKYFNDNIVMNNFKKYDDIYVIRLYQNGNIGCGLPCNRCFHLLRGNGIKNVIYSMDANNFRILNIDETTYTYTTTGNKLLNIDSYLYDNFIISKRIREDNLLD